VNFPDGYNLIKHDKIDSTNEEAKRLIKSNSVHHGLVITAEEQSSGHGRYGRVWESPKGNLYTSVILKLEGDLQTISQVSFVAAVAVGQVLAEILPDSEIQYKWPNDILAGQKKICGILLESVGGNYDYGWFVVGIGINVENCPHKMPFPATYMKRLNESCISAAELLPKIITSLDNQLNMWQNKGFSPIRKAWLAKAYKLKEEIQVNLHGERVEAIFKGINSEGELEISIDGKKLLINSGEVFF
jgi:BirA family biotin operon repressor/biotin-[acetyl-CoA-carboxylase] ligase